MNNLFFTKKSSNEFSKISSSDQRKVQLRLEKLTIPLPISLNIKALVGMSGYFRLRVGSVRVVFEVLPEERVIVIRAVGYRGNMYGKL